MSHVLWRAEAEYLRFLLDYRLTTIPKPSFFTLTRSGHGEKGDPYLSLRTGSMDT
jgi:hypothetical protein